MQSFGDVTSGSTSCPPPRAHWIAPRCDHNSYASDVRSWLLDDAHQPKRIVVVDLETTGFNADADIIEIAAVELVNMVKTGLQFHSLIRPASGQQLFEQQHPAATRCHGISWTDVEDAPGGLDMILDSFGRFVFGASDTVCISGHNVDFDLRMLRRHRCLPQARSLCTKALFCSMYPTEGHRCSLDDVATFLGVSNTSRGVAGYHGALIDASLTAKVLQHLVARLVD